jgi:methylmalonyl-CoA/ethylmalonyl-CoA epimerase
MHKIEHIGIAVENLTISIPLFEQLLNTSCYKQETIEMQGVITAFFKAGDSKIELLQSINTDGTIAKYIEKRGPGVHHIAFSVTDIYAEIERLKKEGFILVNDAPTVGADNQLVCFLHPKSTNGVLIELCQENS